MRNEELSSFLIPHSSLKMFHVKHFFLHPNPYFACYYIQKYFNTVKGSVRILNDNKLIARLQNKDQKALEQIIEKYTPFVSAVIFNVSKGSLSKEDIEETVTDVFVTLWKNADNIIEDRLKGYICRIAKTRALNKISSVSAHQLLNIDDYDLEDDFSISAEVEQKQLAVELREIISEIEMPDREIIVRYYYYLQNTSKIAQVMNLNINTVKSKLRRARDKIKTKLIERGYDL